jgi:non-specific serine/threonine protein kinase/serine/threonine-protein kinase
MPAADRVESLFHQALALPAAERGGLLDRECGGDAELRGRVERLLAAHAEFGQFLEPPADGPTLTHPPGPGLAEPDPVGVVGALLAGRYKLLEVIGEGGMGTVWMAEQREPVKRLVAVKLIKPGMDSRAVLARFEAERQALALMDHPNIAKVLDGGTERGRPFFVMELVRGIPLTEYCDGRQLTVRDRLDLFVAVCAAVQHAHQKGVIHRDLKPANVLVTEHDGRPVPKVIDFGLAKALHATSVLTDKTLHTSFGAVVGTPLYMAPEQVGLNALDVDTRTDVYALGVILYELLTGTTPLEKRRLKEAVWDEVRRLIREEEPPRPSTRLSASDALPTIAARRHVEPAKLSRLVRGELDWIVMRALEKDRSRRYETANGLAMDVQRHLAGEPVLAVPPSAGYRLRKLVRRNRGPVLAAAGVVLALILGVFGTTAGLVRAEAERRRVVAAEADAVAQARAAADERDRAVKAEADARDKGRAAEAEKARATEKAELAEAVSDFLRRDILAATPFQSIGRGQPAPSVTVIQAVDRAAARVGSRFAGRPRVEAAIRQTLGNTYLEFSKLDQAAAQLEKALRLFRSAMGDEDDVESLLALQKLAWVRLAQGRLVESERLHADLMRRAERTLPEGHYLRLTALGHYAYSLSSNGKYDAAEPLFQQAIGAHLRQGETPGLQMVRNNLALMHTQQGRLDAAEALYLKALAEHRRLTSAAHPNTVLLLKNLAGLYTRQRRYREAVPLLEEAAAGERKAFGDQRLGDQVATLRRLASAYAELDRWGDAAEAVRRALDAASRPKPLAPFPRSNYLAEIGLYRLRQGEYRDAEAVLRECLDLRAAADPDAWGTHNARSMLGGALLGQKRYAEAEPLLLAGYEGMKEREAKIPAPGKPRLPEAADRLVELYTALDKPEETTRWRAARAKYDPEPAPPPRPLK